jgi:hypothetical protein
MAAPASGRHAAVLMDTQRERERERERKREHVSVVQTLVSEMRYVGV